MGKDIVFQTVISGALAFVFGQIIQRFFLETLQNYRATRGKIDNKLKFYANIIANPGFPPKEEIFECSKALRDLSCELESAYKQIPPLIRDLVRPRRAISDSAARLIRLSNSLYEREPRIALENDNDAKIIRANLNTPYI